MPEDAVVEFDKDDVSGLAEELTPVQTQMAFRRALQELSIPHSINADGTTQFADEVDYEYFQEPAFQAVFSRHLHEAALDAAMNSLTRQGLVEKIWLDDENEFGYRLVL